MKKEKLPVYINLESCRSTNDELYKLAKQGTPEGTVVVSRSQTAGRGTNGRSFFSPDNTGIYMSILLKGIESDDILHVTPYAAVQVSKALDDLFITQTKIKWVNDIYLNGKKICGILTQAETAQKNVNFIIVGIGINLFKPQGGFPQDIADKAGWILESYSEKRRQSVIEKISRLLLSECGRLSDARFIEEMYRYYEERRFDV